ncbi:MAG: CRISPR-associated endonuclease Cas2 [Parcubacteria group bacterium]|nr:CRISPR-associated endonuclease Cas2 [Parcubacteria group bacterium]
MGELEKKNLRSVRKTKLNRAIIATLAVAGGLVVASVAPNVLGALGRLSGKNKFQKAQGFNRSFSRLVERGYIETSGSGKQKRVELTKKGERFAASIAEGNVTLRKPKRWDGKWRLLIFDIPEKRRRARDRIRLTLQEFGFYKLQDSVWVYPYDCEDFIQLLKLDLRVGKELLYVIADHIEQERALCTHFSLKKK